MSSGQDKHDKQFDPTPRRIRKAREEGNVFRSQEIVSVGMLLIGLSMLFAGAPFLGHALRGIATTAFQSATTTTLTLSSLPPILLSLGQRLVAVVVPFAVVLLMAGMSLNVLQSGWNVTFKPLIPKGNRINPMNGFKRIFSTRGLFNAVKSLLKVAIVGPIVYLTLEVRMPEILTLPFLPMEDVLGLTSRWILILLAQMLLVLLVLSGFDFAFEKWRYWQDLKMSAQELKDEQREAEGDPLVKSKRRQLARELARRPRMDHAVLRSDVVVTNPTHYAVALRYDPTEADAPRVMIKGIRKRALRIKELAAEFGVPMVEDRPLARALYDSVDEEQEIPEELYPAVATILAEIYHRRGLA